MIAQPKLTLQQIGFTQEVSSKYDFLRRRGTFCAEGSSCAKPKNIKNYINKSLLVYISPNQHPKRLIGARRNREKRRITVEQCSCTYCYHGVCFHPSRGDGAGLGVICDGCEEVNDQPQLDESQHPHSSGCLTE
jgi:hypothetical protein